LLSTALSLLHPVGLLLGPILLSAGIGLTRPIPLLGSEASTILLLRIALSLSSQLLPGPVLLSIPPGIGLTRPIPLLGSDAATILLLRMALSLSAQLLPGPVLLSISPGIGLTRPIPLLGSEAATILLLRIALSLSAQLLLIPILVVIAAGIWLGRPILGPCPGAELCSESSCSCLSSRPELLGQGKGGPADDDDACKQKFFHLCSSLKLFLCSSSQGSVRKIGESMGLGA
jgi:hypothetical protein